jgi:hypothetical protein
VLQKLLARASSFSGVQLNKYELLRTLDVEKVRAGVDARDCFSGKVARPDLRTCLGM